MKFAFEVGDRVRFRRFTTGVWLAGEVTDRSFDVVHIYGDNMQTCVYQVRADGGDTSSLCILWDDLEHENVLERLARVYQSE